MKFSRKSICDVQSCVLLQGVLRLVGSRKNTPQQRDAASHCPPSIGPNSDTRVPACRLESRKQRKAGRTEVVASTDLRYRSWFRIAISRNLLDFASPHMILAKGLRRILIHGEEKLKKVGVDFYM